MAEALLICLRSNNFKRLIRDFDESYFYSNRSYARNKLLAHANKISLTI